MTLMVQLLPITGGGGAEQALPASATGGGHHIEHPTRCVHCPSDTARVSDIWNCMMTGPHLLRHSTWSLQPVARTQP
jgi:hypothetical protein